MTETNPPPIIPGSNSTHNPTVTPAVPKPEQRSVPTDTNPVLITGTDATTTTTTTKKTKKRKKKNKKKRAVPPDEIEARYTIREPQWHYLHLRLIKTKKSQAQDSPIDLLTWRSYINAALSQFLGIIGQAIVFDILHTSSTTTTTTIITQTPTVSEGEKGKGTARDDTTSNSTIVQQTQQPPSGKPPPITHESYIRVPREDGPSVSAALGAWSTFDDHGTTSIGEKRGEVTIRVLGASDFLMGVIGGTGKDVFMG